MKDDDHDERVNDADKLQLKQLVARLAHFDPRDHAQK